MAGMPYAIAVEKSISLGTHTYQHCQAERSGKAPDSSEIF